MFHIRRKKYGITNCKILIEDTESGTYKLNTV